MPEKNVAEFLEVQTWFVVRSQSASKSDSKFYIVMSPEETIKFLEARLTKRAVDVCPECAGLKGRMTDLGFFACGVCNGTGKRQ